MVCGPLAAGQVDEGDLAVNLAAVVLLQGDLQDGVGAGRIDVGAVLGGDPDPCAELDDLHQVLNGDDLALGQPHDIDIVLGVFAGVEQVALVQQIVQFPAVDLVEGNPRRQLVVIILLHVCIQVPEDVMGGQEVEAVHILAQVAQHGVGLSRPSLPVGEAGHSRPVERAVEEGADRGQVDVLVGGLVVVGAVEVELVLVDEGS